jgi:hypothetical protein
MHCCLGLSVDEREQAKNVHGSLALSEGVASTCDNLVTTNLREDPAALSAAGDECAPETGGFR